MVLLFYCYEPLRGGRAARLVDEQRELGSCLRLRGRVLVAEEGINGTVQGCAAALASYREAVEAALTPRAIDWKSSTGGHDDLFPDFAVKLVPELVSFGLQEELDVNREGGVHVSPEGFHKLLTETPKEQLRVIDVRNTFEFEVGHFEGAVDPGMTHTAQWPRFVERNLEDLRGRQVLLYCTGGIRCEKASAYLCKRLAAAGSTMQNEGAEEERVIGEALREGASRAVPGAVYQLQGGIHRYLEAFPDSGQFRGANFVFDKRRQMRPEAAVGTTVGRCSECHTPWDKHHGGRVCCVCRALVLVCDSCDESSSHGEYYCAEHAGLRGVYYHFVERFDAKELERQSFALREMLAAELGTKRKNRRATLRKKAEQVEARLATLREIAAARAAVDSKELELKLTAPPRRCRACERPYSECPGVCWGFWKEPVAAVLPLSGAAEADESATIAPPEEEAASKSVMGGG